MLPPETTMREPGVGGAAAQHSVFHAIETAIGAGVALIEATTDYGPAQTVATAQTALVQTAVDAYVPALKT